jgi:serine/threonine protein kinase
MAENSDGDKSEQPCETVISDRYKVLSLLGSGGMGSVYKVEDKTLGKIFAVKVLSPKLTEDQAAFRRFSQEAKASGELNHPNINNVYEQGTTDSGAPFLVMDYLEGETLCDILKKEGRLQYERAIDIFEQICQALEQAHNKGVIHRDVKPSNIIIVPSEGGGELVKVVDFGIAKVLPATDNKTAQLTQTGEIFGSPLYMSPEQCNGENLDARSDIYSLGCTMFETLTGRAPFAATNPFKVMMNQVQMPPPAMRSAAPKLEVPSALEAIIMTCLEKKPADRYQTVSALQADLKRVQSGKRPLATRHKTPANKRRLTRVAGVVAIIAALASGSMYMSSQRTEPPAELATEADERPSKPEEYAGKTLAQWSAEIEREPTNAQNYYNRGRLHDYRDERIDAIQDYTKAIELNPKFTDAYKARAFVYSMVNNYDKALVDANWLINDQPDWSEGYEVRSFIEMSEEDTEHAIEDARKAISLQPLTESTRDNLAYKYYCLASALINEAAYEQAIKTADQGLEIGKDGGNADSLYAARALALCHQQKFGDAIVDIQKAIELNPQRSPHWSILAYAHVGSGNLAEAERALKKVEQVETFPARAFRLKGEIHRITEQYERALGDFSAETSLEQYAPGYRQKANCYIALGQLHSALDDLQRSHAINPKSPITLSYLARIEEQLDHTGKAKEHIKQATDRSSNPVVLANAAEVALHQGDKEKALRHANNSISVDPFAREAFETRARVYEALGKSAEAERDRAKAKKLVPHMDF